MSWCNTCKKTKCCCKTKISSWKSNPCCSSNVQPAPAACCESHEVICKTSVCFVPTCSVVATDSTFFLHFEETCQKLGPLNSNDLFFWHAATGLLRIHSVTNSTYEVSLVDSTKAGAQIEEGDCVLSAVVPAGTTTAGLSTRCLVGNFGAPNLNQTADIFILNGTGIPIGATLTFVWEGQIGSYTVTAFVNSSGNIFQYTVQNSGSGHTPGTIISGGDGGECLVPIEIITEVDLCDLAETNEADSIAACLNGSPRGLVPSAEGDIIVSNSDNIWVLGKSPALPCCVILDGCLKFTGTQCVSDADSVALKDIGLECFEEAFAAAAAIGNQLPVIIDGFFKAVVTAYNTGTNVATFAPVDELYAEVIQFDEGTQICLEECCNNCEHGDQTTNYQEITGEGGDPTRVAVFLYDTTVSWSGNATRQYLIGQNNTTGAVIALEIDATFSNDPDGGPGIPKMSDPLLLRQKICNTSLYGCNQELDLDYNFELTINSMPAFLRAHYSFHHFIQPSATLEDGVSPNPFNHPSAQSTYASSMDGPSFTSTDLEGTSVGVGGPSNAKIFPYHAANLRDYARLVRCNCTTSIVWFHVLLEPLSGINTEASGELAVSIALRRRILKRDLNRIGQPANDPTAEGFNN